MSFWYVNKICKNISFSFLFTILDFFLSIHLKYNLRQNFVFASPNYSKNSVRLSFSVLIVILMFYFDVFHRKTLRHKHAAKIKSLNQRKFTHHSLNRSISSPWDPTEIVIFIFEFGILWQYRVRQALIFATLWSTCPMEERLDL